MSCAVTWAARLDQHSDRGEDGEGGGKDEGDDGVVRPGAAKDAEVQRQISHQVERLLMQGKSCFKKVSCEQGQ